MFLYISIILGFVIKAIIIAIIIIISPYHGCLLLLINTRELTTNLNDSHLNECVYDDDTMSCEVIVYYYRTSQERRKIFNSGRVSNT